MAAEQQLDDKPLPAWKVILVGEEGVGKTSLFRRIHHHDFFPNAKSTIGIDHCTVPVTVSGQQCQLDLWDTGGSERHQSMTMSYYRRSSAVLFVFSRDSASSLVNLEHWLQDTRLFAPDAVCFLVASKQDLVGEINDPVDDSLVVSWLGKQTSATFQEPCPVVTSARLNQNIDVLLERVCTVLLEKRKALLFRTQTRPESGLIVGFEHQTSPNPLQPETKPPSGCRC